MGSRKNLSRLLAADILAMVILYLIPDNIGDWQVKKVIIILLAIAALILIFLISKKRKRKCMSR